ncbi:type II toxin-antitoxin system HicA family toxin [Streptomyces sp. NBC_00448]|uniref:type II toxin-antitoxin system HicA family toxin n=1 Tax=Streptomyces sp. NBC_00448 TaxID=2903652 RepID=UPI003FA7CD97
MSHEPCCPLGSVRCRGCQSSGASRFRPHLHTRGSHAKYRKDDRTVIVPLHRELAPGTVRSILRQADWTVEEVSTHLK